MTETTTKKSAILQATSNKMFWTRKSCNFPDKAGFSLVSLFFFYFTGSYETVVYGKNLYQIMKYLKFPLSTVSFNNFNYANSL